MKAISNFSAIIVLCSIVIISCKKEPNEVVNKKEIPQTIINKIHHLGFSTQNIVAVENGYVVEGDIVITSEELSAIPDAQFLRIGGEEQYRTFNLVTALPRTIKVKFSGSWSASNLQKHTSALDEALARYNVLGLSITFQRVSTSSTADITLLSRNIGPGWWARAGFPSQSGQPYNMIEVNVTMTGNQPQYTIASILAHEIGHCIGFRHTDYMNRAYSCGGTSVNEGNFGVGAVQIPGTPAGPDPNSWMLACIGNGQNTSFNANDIISLKHLYPGQSNNQSIFAPYGWTVLKMNGRAIESNRLKLNFYQFPNSIKFGFSTPCNDYVMELLGGVAVIDRNSIRFLKEWENPSSACIGFDSLRVEIIKAFNLVNNYSIINNELVLKNGGDVIMHCNTITKR